ncbi:AAA family ATPase [Psychroserpens sp. AS72]|uniref:AAA family ATPase n=1 Tax=Psychroserpens sp. AS72 TaxID=3135775 RepID=UPI003175009C
MLTEVNLVNYKCFQDETFSLSNINLFFGLNGRGKSSLLQAILLMSQSVNETNSLKELLISSSLIKLGSFDDIKTSGCSNQENIKFGFKTDIDKINDFEFEYSRDEQDLGKGFLHSFELNGVKSSEELISDSNSSQSLVSNKYSAINYKDDSRILKIFRNVHYVSADRIGPRLYVDKYGVGNVDKTGTRGENSINVLWSNKNELNPIFFIQNKVPKNLTELCQQWLNYIFNGANIEINKKGESVLALNINPKNEDKLYKSVNVGFGYSYILSIVLTCLIAEEDDIIIFENPEAHLHPKAQSRLTHLFTRLASNKVQLFVESHSEHILNGLRVAIADENNIIKKDMVSSYFFGENFKVDKLEIDIKGFVGNWPKDFFDQMEIDNSLIFNYSR